MDIHIELRTELNNDYPKQFEVRSIDLDGRCIVVTFFLL